MKICDRCARHVRLAIALCPFCAAAIVGCKESKSDDTAPVVVSSAPPRVGTVYGGPPVPNKTRYITVVPDPSDVRIRGDELLQPCNNSPGKTTVTLTLSKGTVTDAVASDTTGFGSGEVECITKGLRALSFPVGPSSIRVTVEVAYR